MKKYNKLLWMQTLLRIALTDFLGIPYFHDHYFNITWSNQMFLFQWFIDKKALSLQMME